MDLADIRRRLENLMGDDALPAGFDEEQLRLDIEYNEREFNQQEPETVAFEENFVDDQVAKQVEQEPGADIPLSLISRGLITDNSVLIHYYCNQQQSWSDFYIAFGLYVIINRLL